MRRRIMLSLLILVAVVGSVYLLGAVGFSCKWWTHAALSSAKKVGVKLLLRAIDGSKLYDLPLDRFPYLEKFLEPGL